MLIHDGVYKWKGWGGELLLGSGSCRLRIFDLEKDGTGSLTYLRPIILVVSDVPESTISIRSCPGHIATGISKEFGIDHHRMIYVEYYPASTYGEQKEHIIAERYDIVEFTWQDDKALQPKWRPLKPPMLDTVKRLIEGL
jgi:hypothetical protein